MVFSNCYLPEVLLAANPDTKFIGLPWRAKDMPDFEAAYPDYEYALWHNCELQDEIWNYLADKQKNGDYLELKSGRNNYGLVFKVLKRTKTP